MAHVQELIQPVRLLTQNKFTIKNILQERTVAVNSYSPDITRLQDCDQKVTSIQLERGKNQTDHSICDDKTSNDYIKQSRKQ